MHDPPIDLSILGQLFKDDRDLVREWIELYVDQSPEQFTLLAAHQAAGNADALAMLVHDLRPQAHYLGAHRLLELLVELGELVKREGTAPCGSLVEEVMSLGKQIDVELRATLKRI